MDRALKERIIGAVVLVAIAVLVVPVFLDGPPPESQMVSEPVLLPGQSREPGERRTVVLERDRDQPLPDAPSRQASRAAPAGGNGNGAQPAARPPASEPVAMPDAATAAAAGAGSEQAPPSGQQTPAREEEPERREPPAVAEAAPPARDETVPSATAEPAATESPTGLWAVQIGSFSNKANADRLAASLRAEGYAAFLSRHTTSGGELHRVRVGPQDSRASAEAVAAALRAEGHKGQVVPHP